MPERVCDDWLKTYCHLVRNTEAPEQYWLWSGIYTLGAALERKVWVSYGLDDVWPNHYIVLISPPGKCRKGGPIKLSRKLLESIQVNMAVDSTSPQALAKELGEAVKQVHLPTIGNTHQSPIAINSTEFSSLMKTDIKGMAEFLTAGYDDQDTWRHKVLSREEDKIFGPCLSLFAGTTPTWIANNLPYELFGAGLFSRVAFIVGLRKRRRIPRPTLAEGDKEIMKNLTHDLNIISNLKGPIVWTTEAEEYFDQWYYKLDEKYEQIKDERFHGFIERAHTCVLKTAIALRVSHSDELIFEVDDMGRAIDLVEMIFPTLDKAFGGMGRNPEALSVKDLIEQIEAFGEVSYSTLLSNNWHNVSGENLKKIVESLREMGYIKITQTTGGDLNIIWKGKKEEENV